MRVRLNRTVRVKGRFFKGRRMDRVGGMMFRTVFHGLTVMVAPSLATPPELVPNEGERWEVELEREFHFYDTKVGVAVIYCHPIRELPEIGEGLKPVRSGKPTRPIKGVQRPEEAAMVVRAVLAPVRSKPAPVRHRSPNATNVGATTQKGPHVEITPKGTSRKSRQKQRRRERLQSV